MRPCFVTTSFAPMQHNSGISNALFLLSRYMHEKHGVRSTVYAPVEAWGKKDEEAEFVSIRRFRKSGFMGYDFSASVADLMKKSHNKEKFDLVHSYHYGFFPAYAGYKFSSRNGMPHFFTTAFHPPASAIKRTMMNLYGRMQGGMILGGSAAVFPFNENEKGQLSKYSSGKYEIIPCPVNNDIFFPRKKKFSRKTVTYIGTLLPWKGPQIALDIFNQIAEQRNDVDFMIVGTGPLEKQLRENASKRVKVITNLSSTGVANALSSSDITVCPTLYESFGSAIAESMMCGTPVVSTRVGAVPETTGPSGTLVEYGDWTGMKREIENLLDDDRRRRILAARAIKHSNNYKYEKVSAKIYNTYRKFL